MASDFLKHYGVPRRSGRYPWGSGDNPYQHSGDFLSRVEDLHKSGLSEKEISIALGMSTTRLRALKAIAKEERRAIEVDRAKSLREKGYSLQKIADEMGYKNDSSIRSLLNESAEARMNQAKTTADFLKDIVDNKGIVDVGKGVEKELGISQEKLKEALEILQLEGYEIYGGGVPQINNPGKQTNIKILCPPGTEHKELYNYDNINSVKDYDKILTNDGTEIRKAFEYPSSMDSKRLQIRYGDEGGSSKDGVIELRRGCKDLDLGNSHYAQVRILVDNDRYMKGMAVYSDNLPDGVDVLFNTNKPSGTNIRDVLKKIKDDPSNPFGSLIKEHGGQSYYDDPKGKYTDPITGKKQSLSLINKRAEEGDWGSWNDKLPSQFLAKQSMDLINKQLKLSTLDKVNEFESIKALTNPSVKKRLLQSFADDCDASAVHLRAAALPRQKYQVILPLKSIKDNEVYAPNYKNGETVALIRFPHGGTFEIPILKVNNKNQEGKRILGPNPLDGVGINSKVAERLSGADFDGDTVMVIPCNSYNSRIKITSTPPLKGLEGFDPKMEYPERKGMKYMSKVNTQREMGEVSNLITDMTLKGAKESEIARAVRHSMVVIDAEKHKLDYKKSAEDNGISALKKKYQGRIDENGRYHSGASTLLSRAKSPIRTDKIKGTPKIDPKTGEVSYKYVKETYIDKHGKVKFRTSNTTAMEYTKDAHTLSSGTPQELAYATYANTMKSLANQARKEMVSTTPIPYDSKSKQQYQKEFDSLDSKLNIALKNAPRERQAQVIANAEVKTKTKGIELSKEDKRKIAQQALTEARLKVGAKRHPIDITDSEWVAIQAGAISPNKLDKILLYADLDQLRERSTPKNSKTLSDVKINKINTMKDSGYTNAEIAESLGISSSTVNKYLQTQ